MATTREAAIQFLNDHADDIDAMAEDQRTEAKCHKSMMKIDGMSDGAKKFHAAMCDKCEKTAERLSGVADKHREHAASLGKAVGDQDLNKIVPDGVHRINPNPSFGLGGQLNDTTKVTMIPRYGQPPAKTDVPAEFAALVATDLD